jgi:hypothetical protein
LFSSVLKPRPTTIRRNLFRRCWGRIVADSDGARRNGLGNEEQLAGLFGAERISAEGWRF